MSDTLDRFRVWLARARRSHERYGSPVGDSTVRPDDLALFEALAEEFAILRAREDSHGGDG